MYGISILLTLTYWLSGLAAAAWIGSMILSNMQWGIIVGVLADSPHTTELMDRSYSALQSVQWFAGVTLVLSIVVTLLLERSERQSLGWWFLWLWRSVAIVAMILFAVRSDGSMSQSIENVKQAFGEPVSDPTSQEFEEVLPEQDSLKYVVKVLVGDAALKAAEREIKKVSGSVTGAAAREVQIAGDARRIMAIDQVRSISAHGLAWQILFGSMVLFITGLKEAVWRVQWRARKARQLEQLAELETLRAQTNGSQDEAQPENNGDTEPATEPKAESSDTPDNIEDKHADVM